MVRIRDFSAFPKNKTVTDIALFHFITSKLPNRCTPPFRGTSACAKEGCTEYSAAWISPLPANSAGEATAYRRPSRTLLLLSRQLADPHCLVGEAAHDRMGGMFVQRF